MVGFITGINTACAAIAALFFLRFWRQTADRLFAWFAFAFCLLATHWALLGLTEPTYELRPLFYGIRLLAFSVIIAAIVEKNRVRKSA